VILEGMALGKAVVATNIGGVPETMEDGVTGRLVPPGDPKALATALLGLLGNAGVRERLGRNGRSQVLERFTIEHHVRQICGAYTQLGFAPPELRSGPPRLVSPAAS
jgi:glycosyltransferase involved in cell wall biosynthesis